jgi:hypothetical protein
MSYVDRFTATDDLITHLQTVIPTVTDERLKSEYAGFLSANAVTVYELAIKDIFIAFAEKKNASFGTFVGTYFYQINGRIRIDEIRGYVKAFGEKYLNNFNKKLEEKNKALFSTNNYLQTIYTNLITCRHKYIHANNPTMTFNEVVESYQLGKEIINVLKEIMKR